MKPQMRPSPQRNPVQVLEGGDHEGVEGEDQGAGQEGQRRQPPEHGSAPHARFQRGEPSQQEPAKIEFDQQGDHGNQLPFTGIE